MKERGDIFRFNQRFYIGLFPQMLPDEGPLSSSLTKPISGGCLYLHPLF